MQKKVSLRTILLIMFDELHKSSIGACGGCALRDRCVTTEDNCEYTQAQRWKAIGLAYIIPFVILCICVLIGELAWQNDYWAGLLALGCVALYYLALYFKKPKI